MTRFNYKEDGESKYDKVPTEVLLPPYLASNPYFPDFANGIDEVFDYIQTQLEGIGEVRNPWALAKDAEFLNYVDSSFDGGVAFDTLVQQINLLGFRLSSPLFLNEQTFRIMAKWLGRYWFEKGTETFIDFVSFCLGIDLEVHVLWTRDYVNFIKEKDLAKILRPITRPDKVYFTDFDPLINTEFVAGGGSLAVLQSWSLPLVNSNSIQHSTVGGLTGGVGQTLQVSAFIDAGGGGSGSGGGAGGIAVGPYFPTTHIIIRTDLDNLMRFGPSALTFMFYEVDNFNLVIQSIEGDLEFEASNMDVVVAAYGYSVVWDLTTKEIPNPLYNRVADAIPTDVTHMGVGYSENYNFDTGP